VFCLSGSKETVQPNEKEEPKNTVEIELPKESDTTTVITSKVPQIDSLLPPPPSVSPDSSLQVAFS
jgi:hypothetical protein